ncbi:MAG: response regulator [Pirellulales bacterium]|nr:response regulator [Pirellulales bacterium]
MAAYLWELGRRETKFKPSTPPSSTPHPQLSVITPVRTHQRSVDAHRVAEEARQSEARYRTLFDSIDDGFCVIEVMFNEDGRAVDYRFLETNAVFEQQSGLRHAVGKTILELAPDYESQWFEVYGKVAETGEAVRFEHEEKTLGRWFDVFAFRHGSSGSRNIGVLFNDITTRKEAEAAQALLYQQVISEGERLAEIFKRAPSFMCVLQGPGHVFERVNDQYRELVGRRDVLGKTVRNALPELDGQGFFELLDEVYRTGEPFVGTGMRACLHRQPGGPVEERCVDFVFQPLRAADETITGVIVQGIDVTARIQAEEALRAADRRKTEFLALLAHELRNPLAPIRNGLEILRLASDNTPGVVQAREMMERQLLHMVRLIDDLLDVARISTGKMELRRARISLADAINNALETARNLIESAGHELSVSLPSDPIFLNADLTRLAEVFGNLLSNSAKYTPRGGQISLAVERQGEEAIVTVKDNGIGIPQSSLAAIFDMFSQVDRSIERTTGGLGIGLSLVKGLVELHGGTVTVQSDGPNYGTTFVVRLRAMMADSAPEPVSPRDEVNGCSSARRVLVVDDNQDSGSSMAMALQLRGYNAVTAFDGFEGIKIAEAFNPDVILMDVGMPTMNGYETTRRIRETPWGKGIVIIALTGWGQEGDRVRTKEAGCNAHLVKPANVCELQKLLVELGVETGP